MKPSGLSEYDMSRAFHAALRRMNERFPDVDKELRRKIAFDLGMSIYRLQVEPLLKIVRVVDEYLDIVGVPKVTPENGDQEWIDLVVMRMSMGLDHSELTLTEMEELHKLLTVFGVPTVDSNGNKLLLPDRFRGFSHGIHILHSSVEQVASDAVDELNRNHLPELEAAPGTTPTSEMVLQPTLSLPPEVKKELEYTVKMSLPRTNFYPLVDQLAPEFEAIHERLQAAHAENLQLSEQIILLRKTLQEKNSRDEKQARLMQIRIDDLLKRAEATERQRDQERREHHKESDGLRQNIAEIRATLDQVASGLSSSNEETQRRLIEEALDTKTARDAIDAMERKMAEDAKANKTPRLASPISQPIPQTQPTSTPREEAQRWVSERPWLKSPGSGASTATKTAARPKPAPIKTRAEIRADQLAAYRRQQERTEKVKQATRQPGSPVKTFFFGFTVVLIGIAVILAAILSNMSMVQLGTSQFALVMQTAQEGYLTAAQAVKKKFPDVDLASTAMAAVAADNNAIYEAESLKNFDAWLKDKGKSDAMQVAADTLEKAGGFRYTKARTLDPAYGIKKDGSRALAWQVFISLMSKNVISGDGAMQSTRQDTYSSLSDWFQGYALPSVRESRPWIFDKIPSLEEQYAIRYEHLLSDPPGPPKNCLLPPAVASLKNKVPASVIKARACPVQRLTPALFTSFGKQYPGERELALKHPDKYWDRYCIIPGAITDVHNEANIPVAELRAKACKS